MAEGFEGFMDAINEMKRGAESVGIGPISIGKSKTGKLIVRRGQKIVLLATAAEARSIARHIQDLFGVAS